MDRGTWWATVPKGHRELDMTELTQHERTVYGDEYTYIQGQLSTYSTTDCTFFSPP